MKNLAQRCIFYSSALIAWSAIGDTAVAETTIRVTSDEAACIAGNISGYLLTGMEPVIVVTKSCPELPSNDDIMAALAPQNSGSSLPEPKVGGSDTVLVLLRSELECFGRLYNAGRVATGSDGLVTVSLDACDG